MENTEIKNEECEPTKKYIFLDHVGVKKLIKTGSIKISLEQPTTQIIELKFNKSTNITELPCITLGSRSLWDNPGIETRTYHILGEVEGWTILTGYDVYFLAEDVACDTLTAKTRGQ